MNPHSRLGAFFLRNHPAAAARVLEDYPAESVAQYLAAANPTTTKYIVEYLTPGFAASCLGAIEPQTAGQIFTQLLPDLQITLLRQLDKNTREALLGTLQPARAASLRNLLPYPVDTAGSLMEASSASVQEDVTVREAIRRIKRLRRGMKFYIYAINQDGRLTGVMTLHELIRATQTSRISEVMHKHVISLSPEQSILTVLNSPYWQEYYALPVTDENNTFLGVIRQKSVRIHQEVSLHKGPVSNGLNSLIAIGEMFAVTAEQLLTAFISLGDSLAKRDLRD